MSAFTKEDFIAWKMDPVTKAMYQAVIDRIEDAKADLADSAGVNPGMDRFTTGMIRAFREVLAIDFAMEDEDNA